MTMQPVTTTVRDYETSEALEGQADVELIRASQEAGYTGAVAAYYDAELGCWHHVREHMVSHYRDALKVDVRTVYIEQV